jgi:hypothetical protein
MEESEEDGDDDEERERKDPLSDTPTREMDEDGAKKLATERLHLNSLGIFT